MDRRELEALKAATAILRKAVDDGFYGAITFNLEDGQIKRAERKESLRLDTSRYTD